MNLTQENAPVYEALLEHRENPIVHLDVPGHKGGRGNKELRDFLGKTCLLTDVNSMKSLDNLCHPVSVIKDAQNLAAKAFRAKNAFFIVNGTTAAVQTMIMTACKAKDKIIMPRNVHRSAINALVVSGAIPVYVNPDTNRKSGIPLGMKTCDVKRAIEENPDAVAIMVNNPTYYGICSNLKEIVKLAHEHNMLVLVDEAHGTHLYFGDNMPPSAMDAGADMAAVSLHKTGGSLTQSSLLLAGPNVDSGYIHQIINLTQTTSASYLLMVSLDLARKNLYKNGKEMFAKTVQYSDYARGEINKLGGYYAYSSEIENGDSIYAFDKTKLSVYTRDIGLAGIEVYDILRDEYGIQIEFGDLGNILAIVSAGDRELEIERFISALSEIKRRYQKNPEGLFDHEYINPQVVCSPQSAFYSKKHQVKICESAGYICNEFVMCYPPGIPILAPGERITKEIIDYIIYAKEKGCSLTGTQDLEVNYINVLL